MKTLIALIILSICSVGNCAEIKDPDAVRAIIGEASNQGYTGMLHLAVGIRNRGTLKGVYGLKAKHVDREPKWVWEMAQKAWAESEFNRTHDGSFWGSKIVDKEWIAEMERRGYKLTMDYKDHVFYKN